MIALRSNTRRGLASLCAAGLLTLTGLGAALTAHAQTRDNEVSTSLNKTLTLAAGDVINLSNRYGPVEITAASGSEFKIVMTATAWGSSKSRAEAQLERIALIYEREGNQIHFKTEIESRSGMSWNWNGDENGYRISVKMTMPEVNDLKVVNRYGNTYFMDEVYKGRVTVEQSYGNLKAGRLEASRCSVTVRYGKIDLEAQQDGYLKVAYGSGQVRRVGRVMLDTGYSRVDIDDAADVELDSDYDNLDFKRVGRLRGSASFSGLQIDRLDHSLALTAKYVSGFRIDRISEGFELVDLKGSYSSFTLEFAPEASFDYDIRLKRGNLRYPSEGFEVSRFERDSDQLTTYSGRRGAPNKGRVYIEGSYTNVRFGVIGLSGQMRGER